MLRAAAPSADELVELDRIYREGGLRTMASPHVHYEDPKCPHFGCNQKMEWIDFKLELYGDPEGIYKPLVTSWWSGTGFAGRCPGCRGWVRFTTRTMEALNEDLAGTLPRLPDDWHAVAQRA
jgi:hypothetical protein